MYSLAIYTIPGIVADGISSTIERIINIFFLQHSMPLNVIGWCNNCLVPSIPSMVIIHEGGLLGEDPNISTSDCVIYHSMYIILINTFNDRFDNLLPVTALNVVEDSIH